MFVEKPVVYLDIRRSINDGDFLCWSPTNLPGKVIARYSAAPASPDLPPISHIGMASWAGDVLESHEMLQFTGGRTCNLSALVRQYPGSIHVFCLPGFCQGWEASQSMRRRAGEMYGWDDLWAQGFRCASRDKIRMPWRKRLCDVNRVVQPALWERLYRVPETLPAFCSEGVVSSVRTTSQGAGYLAQFAAWEVNPSMIAAASNYVFTLYFNQDQIKHGGELCLSC